MRYKVVMMVVMISGFQSFAYAQGNFSVLFDGTALVGKTNFLLDSWLNSGLNQMKAKNATGFPGVEARFNQKGRITFGVSYQKIDLKDDSGRITIVEFLTTGSRWISGNKVIFVENGSFSWIDSAQASANAVLGTAYVNLTTRGRIRPFISFGSGFALFDKVAREYDYKYHVTYEVPLPYEGAPLSSLPWQNYIESRLNKGFTLQEILRDLGLQDINSLPSTPYKERVKQVLFKGVAGVNIYPVKHIVLSLGGGYINGPSLSFGAGFTF